MVTKVYNLLEIYIVIIYVLWGFFHQIVDAMDYAVYANDVEHVVLDNLQFMLSGQGKGMYFL